jgi:hypothetical protein
MEHLADIKPKILSLLGDNRHSRRILIGNEPGPMLDADYAFAGRHNEDDVFLTPDTVCVLKLTAFCSQHLANVGPSR